jgi:hypothetical protein
VAEDASDVLDRRRGPEATVADQQPAGQIMASLVRAT